MEIISDEPIVMGSLSVHPPKRSFPWSATSDWLVRPTNQWPRSVSERKTIPLQKKKKRFDSFAKGFFFYLGPVFIQEEGENEASADWSEPRPISAFDFRMPSRRFADFVTNAPASKWNRRLLIGFRQRMATNQDRLFFCLSQTNGQSGRVPSEFKSFQVHQRFLFLSF